MKTSIPFARGAATAAAGALLLTTLSAQAAPKKKVPAEEDGQPQPAAHAVSSTKKKTAQSDETAAKTGAKPATAATKSKSKTPPLADTTVSDKKKQSVARTKTEEKEIPAAKGVKTKGGAAPETASAAPPPEKKKGFFKGLFGGKKKEEAAESETEPALARAKTAKPLPVKEVKPVKLAAAVPAVPAAVEEPKKKHGLFSFLRGGGASKETSTGSEVPEADKIERPADWQDHRVIKEDSVGLYEFGPAQSNGPDLRLDRGTMVTLKRLEKGWALVQTNGGRSGYIDASSLRGAAEGDFAAPVVHAMATASASPASWAPAPPPPDLPDRPAALDSESGLMLLPPLELEPKPKKQ